MTNAEMDALTENLPTKSSKIRMLEANGASRVEIATYLNIRYQHVRNVLVAPAPSVRPKTVTQTETIASKIDHQPLTIAEAKLGLSAHFGVPTEAIEITIRG